MKRRSAKIRKSILFKKHFVDKTNKLLIARINYTTNYIKSNHLQVEAVEVAFGCPEQNNPQGFQIFVAEKSLNVDGDLQVFLCLG